MEAPFAGGHPALGTCGNCWLHGAGGPPAPIARGRSGIRYGASCVGVWGAGTGASWSGMGPTSNSRGNCGSGTKSAWLASLDPLRIVLALLLSLKRGAASGSPKVTGINQDGPLRSWGPVGPPSVAASFPFVTTGAVLVVKPSIQLYKSASSFWKGRSDNMWLGSSLKSRTGGNGSSIVLSDVLMRRLSIAPVCTR